MGLSDFPLKRIQLLIG